MKTTSYLLQPSFCLALVSVTRDNLPHFQCEGPHAIHDWFEDSKIPKHASKFVTCQILHGTSSKTKNVCLAN